MGKPAHPDDLASHNCLVLARPGAPIAAWSFQDGGQRFSVKVRGDRQASNGDVIRDWALAGLGVAFKNAWNVCRDLAAGRLETALDEFAADRIDLYAVQPGGLPHRRVAALVEFLKKALNNQE